MTRDASISMMCNKESDRSKQVDREYVSNQEMFFVCHYLSVRKNIKNLASPRPRDGCPRTQNSGTELR